jgi:dipeptidyl aminopeptidase/acylaminoacyl peptidase
LRLISSSGLAVGDWLLRRFFYTVLTLLCVGFGGTLFYAGSLAAPHLHAVGPPPIGLRADPVEIGHGDGNRVAGWFVAGDTGKPGVLLLHGVRSDRREMLGRARFLANAGYSVLLVDMQAHGETPGEHITFGFKESYDVRAAVDFLRGRVRSQKVGIIGVSLGGAAALLGEQPSVADAVILEAVYSTIERAVENRIAIRLGPLGAVLAPLLTWQLEPRIGVPAQALSPLRAITRLSAPVLIVSGADDRHTLQDESRRLFAAAKAPKELWLIDGARHQDLHGYAGAVYEKRVLQFFKRYLEGLVPGGGSGQVSRRTPAISWSSPAAQ